MGNSYGAASFPDLFRNCVLWFNGESETVNGFPIVPSGVTVTPTGTWSNPLDLGNNKILKTFDGSTNLISLTDNAAWTMFEGDFTITGWFRQPTGYGVYIGQQVITGSETDYWYFQWTRDNGQIDLKGKTSNVDNFNYRATSVPTADTWYHLTAVRSGLTCLIYINAVSQSVTAYQAWRNTTDIAQPLQIGWSWSYQRGNTKDLLIYKGRALTLPEIKLIMARTHPTTGTGMMPVNGDYWRLS